MFLDSFDKVDSMPGTYSITLDPNISPMQNRKCSVPIEAKKDTDAQLKEMALKTSQHKWKLHLGSANSPTLTSQMGPWECA